MCRRFVLDPKRDIEGSNVTMSIPIGLQLYSLRDNAQSDFISVLKAVADIGYEGVEFE